MARLPPEREAQEACGKRVRRWAKGKSRVELPRMFLLLSRPHSSFAPYLSLIFKLGTLGRPRRKRRVNAGRG